MQIARDHARGVNAAGVTVSRVAVERDAEGPAAESTAYDQFDLWSWDGTLNRVHEVALRGCREGASREASSTAVIIDSLSVNGAKKEGLQSASIRWSLEDKRREMSEPRRYARLADAAIVTPPIGRTAMSRPLSWRACSDYPFR